MRVFCKTGFIYIGGPKIIGQPSYKWGRSPLQMKKDPSYMRISVVLQVSLSRVNEPGQEETDQRVMTLFPALNLEALRVAADTLVPRFIPGIPKIVTVKSRLRQPSTAPTQGSLTRFLEHFLAFSAKTRVKWIHFQYINLISQILLQILYILNIQLLQYILQ
ncbi:Hypothetical_protein [Hexamita inflata]|uniref:Hypothetical_protein n=1 Tax=Hexamita inflata TaxID=28002 RepID=A0AA86QNJ3_9EUKA|nr:Hypothetical protein HINF_LOCUS43974 [Hexamita inflata]